MLGGWRFSWLFVVVAGTVVAFLGRVVLVALARHRKPALAAAAERWWSWVPLAIVAGVGIWIVPVIGIAVTVGMVVALMSGKVAGSPFRPRR
jgi:hypothetical protein